MKPIKYDRLIDNSIAFGWHMTRCLVWYMVTTFVVGVIIFALKVFVWAELTGIWILPISALITIIVIYTTITLYKTANKKYQKVKKINIRDIWIAWSTSIFYNNTGLRESLYNECVEWIDENIDGLYRSHYDYHEGFHFYFIKATDAIAFKIVWDERCQKKDI